MKRGYRPWRILEKKEIDDHQPIPVSILPVYTADSVGSSMPSDIGSKEAVADGYGRVGARTRCSSARGASFPTLRHPYMATELPLSATTSWFTTAFREQLQLDVCAGHMKCSRFVNIPLFLHHHATTSLHSYHHSHLAHAPIQCPCRYWAYCRSSHCKQEHRARWIRSPVRASSSKYS